MSLSPPRRIPEHQLVANDLSKRVGDKVLWSNISFSVARGETLFVRGPSGAGKTLLLRVLASLDPLQSGSIDFEGRSPEQIGVPKWRASVTYVFQQRVALKNTPSELYYTAQRFAAQRGRPRGDLPAIIHELGLEQDVLLQPWAELSGGQAQRVQIAIAVALRPSILLLDEPTSSLDADSTRRVERVLKNSGAGLIWVSHDPYQPARVGGRILDLPAGIECQVSTPPSSPHLSSAANLHSSSVAFPKSPLGPSEELTADADGESDSGGVGSVIDVDILKISTLKSRSQDFNTEN